MPKIQVAINGFGRIGRHAFRQLLQKSNVEVVAINDLTDRETLAHLLKYDSAHGKFEKDIEVSQEGLKVAGKEIRVLSERDPSNLPWKKMQIDVVLESTGLFLTREKAENHIRAGARKVVLSAPAKDRDIKSIVLGVNENIITADDDVLSNSSCTTNCLAPLVKTIDDLAGIETGFLATIHAYTSDQSLVDAPHKDLRRARAAAVNIIPTSTGAAKAVGLVLPHLEGKLNGHAYRVPVVNGSVTDFVCTTQEKCTPEQINDAFRKAANGPMKGILYFNEEPIVSSDIIGNTHSCIFESELTMVQEKQLKVVAWYDNEIGYSSRTADLIALLGEKF